MGIWTFQSNLNKGELDPRLTGRLDIDAYYNGLKTAKNVLAIPQGGMKKRAGMEYFGTATADGRLERFSFNVEQEYLLAFSDLEMKVFKDRVLQATVVTPWTLAQLPEFDYIQSADTVIITHPDVEPRKIVRTSDTVWTISTLGLTNVPQYNFDDGSSPTPVSEIQTVTFTLPTEGDNYKISLDGFLTDTIIFAGDSATNAENIRSALQSLPNTFSNGVSVAAGSLTAYTVTFAGDSAYPYGLMSGTQVLVVDSGFRVVVARTQTGVSGDEDTWSATRGWPSTATFHEGRLYFGGSKTRPATLWGSVVNDFFNFDTGKTLDDESIEATLDTDQVNAIEAIFSNRSLQIFTSGGEFYVPASPVTPSNIAVKPQSNQGSRRVRPVTIDGVTLFLQRTGKALIQFVYIDDYQANESKSVSILSPHLIKSPIQMQVSRGTDTTDANYVYILNSDGTLTVFNTLVSDGVTAFTRWETTGNIKSIAVVDNELNFLVERTILGSSVYYLERESDLLNTDSGVITTGLASDTLTGLSHLNGELVNVKADGAVMLDKTVAGGQIITEREADTIEAGLPFSAEIETMPLNQQTQRGMTAAKKKRILRVAINMFESNGVIVNGERIADKTIGQDQFNAPEPKTGLERMFIHGWTLEATVRITQTTPMPMTILAIGMEVTQ